MQRATADLGLMLSIEGTQPEKMTSLLLNMLNFSTLSVCMVLKVPQVMLLIRAKSGKGVSLKALVLELTGYIVFVSYEINHEYPAATYMEYPALIVQDTILLMLILHFDGNLKQSLLFSGFFVAGWQILTLQSWITDLAMGLCTFISASSKLAQLQCLWESKDAGQVSTLTWAMSSYTCLARILTTILTSGDMQVLLRFVVMTTLNFWVLATVVFYKRGKKVN